jgi:hypothetical protein
VKGLVGALAVVALLGIGVYVTFVNPSYEPDAVESIAWTNNCADENPAVEHDADTAGRIRSGLDWDAVTVLKTGPAGAFVFFFKSDEEARSNVSDTRRFVRGYILERLRRSGLGEDEVDRDRLSSSVRALEHPFVMEALLSPHS